MRTNNIDFNKELLNSISPTGCEECSTRVYDAYMKELKMHRHIFTDSMYNSVWCLGNPDNAKKRILIEGHIDSCSFLVSNITSNGFLNIIRQGGCDKKVIQGQSFTVITQNGTHINAISPKKAIHLEKQDERCKAADINAIVLDIGCNNQDEVKDMGVNVGDVVIYDNKHQIYAFGKNGQYVVSQNLDDKAGVMCVYDVAKNVKKYEKLMDEKGICVFFAVTSSEETGTIGATNMVMHLNQLYHIDNSISIDCTHSISPEIGGDINEYSNIKVGDGAILSFGPATNREFMYQLVDVANKNAIKYKRQATGAQGTNCNAIQMYSVDCATALISYPLQGMHTTVEKVAWNDLDEVSNLIQGYISSLIH